LYFKFEKEHILLLAAGEKTDKMKLLQILFMIINVIFFVMGGTMLGLGIWIAVDDNALQSVGTPGMNDALFSTAIYMTIGIGAGVFLIGFLGCFGAIKIDSAGKNIPLKLYFVLVKLILITEITTIILMAIFWSSLTDSVKDAMTYDVKNEYVDETATDGYSESWNKMQIKWKCCGGDSHMDYAGSNYAIANPGNRVPWTCCVMRGSGDKLEDVLNVTMCRAESLLAPSSNVFQYLHSTGCYYGLQDFVDRNAAIIIGVTCGFIGLQLVGSVFACIMMKK